MNDNSAKIINFLLIFNLVRHFKPLKDRQNHLDPSYGDYEYSFSVSWHWTKVLDRWIRGSTTSKEKQQKEKKQKQTENMHVICIIAPADR